MLDVNIRFHVYSRGWDLKIQLEDPSGSCDDTKCLSYPFNLSELRAINATQDRKLIFITAGYWAREENKWQTLMKDRFLELYHDVCVVLVSWTGGNNGSYDRATRNTRLVGRSISALVYYLGQVNNLDSINNREFLSNIHLIGHSLGAHISSQVGKDFKGKIGRITGLDPAGPNFNGLARHEKLDKSDARLVDVFHTDGGITLQGHLGIEEPLGHLDFYINGGSSVQPGCLAMSSASQVASGTGKFACSHKRATLYMISLIELELDRQATSSRGSLKDRQLNRFWSYQAESYDKFLQGSSFGSLCPKLASFEVDSRSIDMDRCMVPLDLLASVEDYRDELQLAYNINFDPEGRPNQRLYFQTADKEPFLNNHDFIQLQLDTRNSSNGEYKVKLIIEEQEFKMQAESHQDGSQTRLIIPYLSPVFNSRRNLDLVEIEDFYLNGDTNNTRELLKRVCQILPREIRVAQVESPGIWGRLWDRITGVDVINKLELVAIQPLRKLDRILVATYSAGEKDPKLVILDEGDEVPENPVWDEAVDSKSRESLIIDTIYVGPKRIVATDSI